MHYDSLVDQLIDDQDNSAHIADQTFSLELVFEDLVEALMDAVEHLTQNQLVVFGHSEDVY